MRFWSTAKVEYELKLFNSAEDYRKSAEYLLKKPDNYHQSIFLEHARASVLCLSFALELYLKCLLHILISANLPLTPDVTFAVAA